MSTVGPVVLSGVTLFAGTINCKDEHRRRSAPGTTVP